MKQVKIMELLQEAASPQCGDERRNAILLELEKASPAFGRDRAGSRSAGLLLLLDKLYVDTVIYRPDLLPSLFPVFALICGDTDGTIMCHNVDWSLLSKTTEGEPL